MEVALEMIPGIRGSREIATITWLGIQIPGGIPPENVYVGARAGFLNGPLYNGWLMDVHAGVESKGSGPVRFRLEPAVFAGLEEVSLVIGARIVAGLSWNFFWQ